MNIRYSGARHKRGNSASQDNDEAERKRGREERVSNVKVKKTLMKCVHVRREYVGGGTGKDMTDDNEEQGSGESDGIKVTWRNMWKPREVVSREEETTIGKEEGESTESRRKVQQYKGTRKKETLDPGKRIGSEW